MLCDFYFYFFDLVFSSSMLLEAGVSPSAATSASTSPSARFSDCDSPPSAPSDVVTTVLYLYSVATSSQLHIVNLPRNALSSDTVFSVSMAAPGPVIQHAAGAVAFPFRIFSASAEPFSGHAG